MKFAERAYLVVESWQYNGPFSPLVGDLLNTGRTPATLGKYDVFTDIRRDAPPVVNYEHL
jgi:hypothetical protein